MKFSFERMMLGTSIPVDVISEGTRMTYVTIFVSSPITGRTLEEAKGAMRVREEELVSISHLKLRHGNFFQVDNTTNLKMGNYFVRLVCQRKKWLLVVKEVYTIWQFQFKAVQRL